MPFFNNKKKEEKQQEEKENKKVQKNNESSSLKNTPKKALPPPQLPTNSPILRAVQGGTSGAVLGLFLSLPMWIRSKRVVPSKAVLTEIGANAAMSASSEFVESSIERIRGRTDDLWAPFIGTAFPYVAIETGKVAAALKKKEKVDWKERGKRLVKQMAFPVGSTILIRSILLNAEKKTVPALNK